jgi:hypothetical protein
MPIFWSVVWLKVCAVVTQSVTRLFNLAHSIGLIANREIFPVLFSAAHFCSLLLTAVLRLQRRWQRGFVSVQGEVCRYPLTRVTHTHRTTQARFKDDGDQNKP